jgi:hypothetical protein
MDNFDDISIDEEDMNNFFSSLETTEKHEARIKELEQQIAAATAQNFQMQQQLADASAQQSQLQQWLDEWKQYGDSQYKKVQELEARIAEFSLQQQRAPPDVMFTGTPPVEVQALKQQLQSGEILANGVLESINSNLGWFTEEDMWGLSNIWMHGSGAEAVSTSREQMLVLKMMCVNHGLALKDVLAKGGWLVGGWRKCKSVNGTGPNAGMECNTMRAQGWISCGKHKKNYGAVVSQDVVKSFVSNQ